MSWYAKAYCPCCAECTFREGNACAKQPRRVMCDAHCPDRAVSGGPGALLTDEERARCAAIAAQPQARYRLLTRGEMECLTSQLELPATVPYQNPVSEAPTAPGVVTITVRDRP